MSEKYQFPYSKVIREDGQVIPATDHNKQENQIECLTDALGDYDFDAGTVENRFDTIESEIIVNAGDIAALDVRVTALDVRVTILEGEVVNVLDDLDDVDTTTIIPNPGEVLTFVGPNWESRPTAADINDLGDVNVPSPTPGNVLTFAGPTDGWVDAPVAAELGDLLDVDLANLQDGDSIVFVAGTGTDDGVWRPRDRSILIASGVPNATAEGFVEEVNEIRFISQADVGEDHVVTEVADGVAYVGGGPPPGDLSLLSGLVGLVTGRLSEDPLLGTGTDPDTTYPPAVAPGDLYDSITQNSAWTFDTDQSEFGSASLGNLILSINGVDVANVDLFANFVESDRDVGQDVVGNYNITGSGDPVAGGVITFPGGSLTLLSVAPSGGIPVDGFQQGVAQIVLATPSQRKGYNILTLRHETIIATTSATLEWFFDTDPDGGADDPIVTGVDLNEGTPVTKPLSGVSYYDTGSTFDLDVDGEKLFNNVYHSSEEPLVVSGDLGADVINVADPSVSGLSTPPEIGEVMMVATDTLSALTAGVQDNSIRATVTPRDPYASYAGVQSPNKNFVAMSAGPNSTDVFDDFTDERYRLPNTTDFDTVIPGLPGPPSSDSFFTTWDSSVSLLDASRAAELQVYDFEEASAQNRLRYPAFDYSIGASFQPQPAPDYSGLPAVTRSYYRVFRSTSGAQTNGIITLPGIAEADLAAGVGLRIKIPTRTVWLDITAPFNAGTFPTGAPLSGGSDGEGCRINAGVNSLDINGRIEFSLGTIGTNASSDFQLILEITYTGAGVTEITGAGAGLSIDW